MKNLPSFSEFKKYEELIESVDPTLIQEVKNLQTPDTYHSVNEGQLLDSIKNTISKFFLGSFSKVGVIDHLRDVLLKLEIDLVENKHKLEEELEQLSSQIAQARKEGNKDKEEALSKDRDSKIREFSAYSKAQKLKISKAQDLIKKAIDGNKRRKDYYEVGRAEDEIALAELEYKLAKDKSDSSELKKYEDKLAKAKEDAAQKAEKMEDKLEDKAKEDDEVKKDKGVETTLDAEIEKKKISRRKGKDIIKRKNELAKDIADLKSELEIGLNSLKSKVEKKSLQPKAIKKYMVDLLDLSSALDAKKNLLKLLANIGKSEDEISDVLSKESEFTALSNKINQSISDGQDANTGTKKIINAIFSKVSRDGVGEIEVEKIKDAINKINK